MQGSDATTTQSFDSSLTEVDEHEGKLGLKEVVELGSIPINLSSYDRVTKSSLLPYDPGTAIKAVYVTKNGGGPKDGASWVTAWSEAELKNKLESLDASSEKVYLFLVASGVYTAGSALSMKNNVAIVGGWDGSGSWKRSGKTVFSGGDAHAVFHNTDLSARAVLAWATVSHAGEGTEYDDTSGMYNSASSPTLTYVTFSENKGGGMHAKNSKALLNHVTFYKNTSLNGGGMYIDNSSPQLINVSFIENKAVTPNNSNGDGGGLYTYGINVQPLLVNVTFYGNTAAGSGGALYHYGTRIDLINVSVLNNSAKREGGGLFSNPDNPRDGMLITNSILWGNTVNKSTLGAQLFLNNKKFIQTTDEAVFLRNTLVQHGLGGSEAANGAGTLNSAGGGLSSSSDPLVHSVFVHYSNPFKDDPGLLGLETNGGFVQTAPISSASSAINKGSYVKIGKEEVYGSLQTYYYYSEDRVTWYKTPTESTLSVTPPDNAIDLTATDARGYTRIGAPDLGAYEYGGQKA